MISTEPIIYCTNPECEQPINAITDSLCASCQTPLVFRYLWASGAVGAKIPVGSKVGNRYEVVKQQIWLDTQPGLLPTIPAELTGEAIAYGGHSTTAYLKLYPHSLHLPQPYGMVSVGENENIWLLENVPIDNAGNIYPSITDVWEQATATRQVYWLWQIIQLWATLSNFALAKALLRPENLRVQGWCVRLLELPTTPETADLKDLGLLWQSWLSGANTNIAAALGQICQQMCQPKAELKNITTQLNQLLLATAAELPLTVQMAGVTDAGATREHNEDTCYPNQDDGDDLLLANLAIACDGIGGHAGGEVASQLAVQSLKLQIRALLAEIKEQPEVITPDLLEQQITACLRVVNNVIWSRNDEQKRQGRERMATTLVMALQVPQRIKTISGKLSENAHELYLASVGDSRAYWITSQYCQLLTIDDDMATREIRLGRSLYRQALQRPDAHLLTQALGTKEAENLRVFTKRLILEEEGILLLCTDGLSDRHLVEQYWQDYATPILTGQLTPEAAAQSWVQLANEKNGEDNTSVVVIFCRVNPEPLIPLTEDKPLPVPVETEETAITLGETPELTLEVSETTETALVPVDEENTTEEPPLTPVTPPSHGKKLVLLGGMLVLLLGTASLGLFAWWRFYPQSFQQMCRRLPPDVQQICPPR